MLKVVCVYLNTCRKPLSRAYVQLHLHVVRVRVADQINELIFKKRMPRPPNERATADSSISCVRKSGDPHAKQQSWTLIFRSDQLLSRVRLFATP